MNPRNFTVTNLGRQMLDYPKEMGLKERRIGEERNNVQNSERIYLLTFRTSQTFKTEMTDTPFAFTISENTVQTCIPGWSIKVTGTMISKRLKGTVLQVERASL